MTGMKTTDFHISEKSHELTVIKGLNKYNNYIKFIFNNVLNKVHIESLYYGNIEIDYPQSVTNEDDFYNYFFKNSDGKNKLTYLLLEKTVKAYVLEKLYRFPEKAFVYNNDVWYQKVFNRLYRQNGDYLYATYIDLISCISIDIEKNKVWNQLEIDPELLFELEEMLNMEYDYIQEIIEKSPLEPNSKYIQLLDSFEEAYDKIKTTPII